MRDRRHDDGPGDNTMIWFYAVYIAAIGGLGYGVWRLMQKAVELL